MLIERAMIKSVDLQRQVARVLPERSQQSVEIEFSRLCQQNSQENQQEARRDLVKLNLLNQPEILSVLQQNYNEDSIYTFMGPSLIVLNPYKALGDKVYGNHVMEEILSKLAGQTRNLDVSALRPHIYSIAAKAFWSLKLNQQKQAIVISGESG